MLRHFVCVIILLCTTSFAQTVPGPAVSSSRLAHIRHGINLSEWFAQVYDPRGYTKEHFQDWTTSADIALIKSAGFDHVRLSVNPQPMMDAAQKPNGSAEYYGYLDAAVKMILDAGLSVEIDMHPDSDFKAKLNDNDFVERFADYWRGIAQHYSSWDTERVFFEILNEPEMHDGYRWQGVAARIVKAVRQGAPSNTILVPGASWDNNDDMIFMEPLRDPNLLYVFHFYSPHIFTHQGATWGAYYWTWLKDLHYPASPQNAAQVADTVPEATARLAVVRYGEDHWDSARIDAEIGQAADWAKRNGVQLVCNEFGVYRHAQPADRLGWIKDARTSLEHHGISWAMWDYSGSFGVVTTQNGKHVLDEDTVKALGLR